MRTKNWLTDPALYLHPQPDLRGLRRARRRFVCFWRGHESNLYCPRCGKDIGGSFNRAHAAEHVGRDVY